ncbi:hypothetical protein ACLOJK_040904 [Asimina triloba]
MLNNLCSISVTVRLSKKQLDGTSGKLSCKDDCENIKQSQRILDQTAHWRWVGRQSVEEYGALAAQFNLMLMQYDALVLCYAQNLRSERSSNIHWKRKFAELQSEIKAERKFRSKEECSLANSDDADGGERERERERQSGRVREPEGERESESMRWQQSIAGNSEIGESEGERQDSGAALCDAKKRKNPQGQGISGRCACLPAHLVSLPPHSIFPSAFGHPPCRAPFPLPAPPFCFPSLLPSSFLSSPFRLPSSSLLSPAIFLPSPVSCLPSLSPFSRHLPSPFMPPPPPPAAVSSSAVVFSSHLHLAPVSSSLLRLLLRLHLVLPPPPPPPSRASASASASSPSLSPLRLCYFPIGVAAVEIPLPIVELSRSRSLLSRSCSRSA